VRQRRGADNNDGNQRACGEELAHHEHIPFPVRALGAPVPVIRKAKAFRFKGHSVLHQVQHEMTDPQLD
jgi:predicted kinase